MFHSQVDKLNEARAECDDLIVKLGEMHLKVSRYRDRDRQRLEQVPPPAGIDYSVREALAFSQQAVRALKRLPLKKRKPVSAWTIGNISGAMPKIKSAVEKLAQDLMVLDDHSRNILVSDGMTLVEAESSIVLATFTSSVEQLKAGADELLDGVLALANGIALESSEDDALEDNVIRDDVIAVSDSLATVESSAREADALLPVVRSAVHSIEEHKVQVDKMLSDAEARISETQKRLEELEADVRNSVSTVTESAGGASARLQDLSALKSQAEEATNAIQSFATNLDRTKSRVNSVVTKAQGVTSEFDGIREKVSALITQAESMVSGATVAGLAQAFGDERESLDKSMKGAMLQFIIGILLLMLSTGVLAAYVFNIPFFLGKINLSNPAGGKYELTAAGIFARAIIILGPFWLTRFAASRYRSLFDLRQQYSHKYNMAFSVEGFKQQAPSYAETISAWVFTIVAANPVLGKAGRPMDEVPTTTIRI